VTCPSCNGEIFSDSAQSCPDCGRPFLKRPRVELVPSLPAERVEAGLGLFGAASAGFNHSEVVDSDRTPPAEVVEAEWTRIEKSSLRRAVFSRVSEQLAKPAAHLSWRKPTVNGTSHATGASHEPLASREPETPEISSTPAIEPHRSNGRMILLVNRAESVMRDCAVCGGGLTSTLGGERLLLANVTETVSYLLCAKCGEKIMAHVHSSEVAERYAWDWAIPLREVTQKVAGN
jgi:predicted RNA-binding Zn-ribbon protein involved in translation (DUF1610 family)